MEGNAYWSVVLSEFVQFNNIMVQFKSRAIIKHTLEDSDMKKYETSDNFTKPRSERVFKLFNKVWARMVLRKL